MAKENVQKYGNKCISVPSRFPLKGGRKSGYFTATPSVQSHSGSIEGNENERVSSKTSEIIRNSGRRAGKRGSKRGIIEGKGWKRKEIERSWDR